ncbi:MAG TPA: GGDEF domain-containing protein [Candidatus Limnocylindrales bacterium]
MAPPDPARQPRLPDDAPARHARRSWRILVAAFGLLCGLTLADVVADGARPVSLLVAALVVLAASAAVVHRQASVALEVGRRSDAESFARILQALSRSVSPDAVISAIVEELGASARADHVAVIRLQPDEDVLDATLVSMRPGVPTSTTVLPASLLIGPTEVALETMEPARAIPVAAMGAPVLAAATAAETSSAYGARPGSTRRGASGLRGSSGSEASDVPLGRRGLPVAGPPGARQAQRVADRLAARVGGVYGLRHPVAAPLTTDRGVVGAIVLSRRTADAWSPAALRLLGAAADEASAALSRLYSQREAEAKAATDALTGLPNRRYFDEFCGLLSRRRRAADAVGVLMVDIDHFKRLNDRHGHSTGDAVLRLVAGAIGRSVRDDDVPARYGGEEFVVLLRNPSPPVAAEIGERIRWAVRTLDLAHLGIDRVTVSVGVAVGRPAAEPGGQAEAVEDLVERADRALYRAKRQGRDRVVPG